MTAHSGSYQVIVNITVGPEIVHFCFVLYSMYACVCVSLCMCVLQSFSGYMGFNPKTLVSLIVWFSTKICLFLSYFLKIDINIILLYLFSD